MFHAICLCVSQFNGKEDRVSAAGKRKNGTGQMNIETTTGPLTDLPRLDYPMLHFMFCSFV
jgi:hypothetical protein